MPITVKKGKVLDLTYKMTLIDRLYLPAIIKGLSITLKHFLAVAVLRRQYTMQYPEQKMKLPVRYRGRHYLKLDEKERERCVACILCQRSCPADAIYITGEETRRRADGELENSYPTEKHSVIWNLDYNRCIFCGFCQEACPKGAIFLEEDYDMVTDDRSTLLYNKQRLLEKKGGPIRFRD